MMSWIRVDSTRVFQGIPWLCLPCWKKGFAAQLCRTWLFNFRRSMPALHGCVCPKRETSVIHQAERWFVLHVWCWSMQCQTQCHVDFLQKFPGEGTVYVAHSQRFLQHPSPLGHPSCPPRTVRCPFALYTFHLLLLCGFKILCIYLIFGCAGSLLSCGLFLRLWSLGFSLWWLLLVWSTGSRVWRLQWLRPLSSVVGVPSWVLELGLSSCGTWA